MADLLDNRWGSLLHALELLGVELRYNVRAHQTEWRHPSFPDWTPENARLTAKLKTVLSERFTMSHVRPLAYSQAKWDGAINTILYDSEIDPFREWLESLPEWDRVARLDDWFASGIRHRRQA